MRSCPSSTRSCSHSCDESKRSVYLGARWSPNVHTKVSQMWRGHPRSSSALTRWRQRLPTPLWRRRAVHLLHCPSRSPTVAQRPRPPWSLPRLLAVRLWRSIARQATNRRARRQRTSQRRRRTRRQPTSRARSHRNRRPSLSTWADASTSRQNTGFHFPALGRCSRRGPV